MSVESGSAEVSTLRERIAAQIDAHTPSGAEGTILCWCGDWFHSYREHAEHVADAVAEALDLTEEWGVQEPATADDAVFGTWHKTRASAESHCETIRDNWRRSPTMRWWKKPTPIPVRRWVSSWSVVGDE